MCRNNHVIDWLVKNIQKFLLKFAEKISDQIGHIYYILKKIETPDLFLNVNTTLKSVFRVLKS